MMAKINLIVFPSCINTNTYSLEIVIVVVFYCSENVLMLMLIVLFYSEYILSLIVFFYTVVLIFFIEMLSISLSLTLVQPLFSPN